MAGKSTQDILLMRWAAVSVTGLLINVLLYCLGITPACSLSLVQTLQGAPFLLPPDAPCLSPGMAFMLDVTLTLALSFNLLLIRRALHRFCILGVFLMLVACFTPVLALWGIFFNALPVLISTACAGMAASILPHRAPAPRNTTESPLTDHE